MSWFYGQGYSWRAALRNRSSVNYVWLCRKCLVSGNHSKALKTICLHSVYPLFCREDSQARSRMPTICHLNCTIWLFIKFWWNPKSKTDSNLRRIGYECWGSSFLALHCRIELIRLYQILLTSYKGAFVLCIVRVTLRRWNPWIARLMNRGKTFGLLNTIETSVFQ